MPLKNTYITKGAGYYIGLAQEALVGAGATGVAYAYDEGRVTGLTFSIVLKGQPISFKLPVDWKAFQQVLIKERAAKANDDDYAYRVAWACTKDWIEAQMAFIKASNVTITQVFLPYAISENGETLFEKIVRNPNLLLGGSDNQ